MQEQKRVKNFEKMLIEAAQGSFSFYAWQSIGGVVEKCELKIKAYRKDYNEIELEFQPEHQEAFSRVISGDRLLNIYVPELSVSFTSELRSVTPERKVKLSVPKEYSFHERRKHDRVQPSKTCYVSFEMKKVMVRKSIFDISLGGVAVILSKSDIVSIEKGRKFPVFILEIGGRKIKLEAECVNSIAIDRYKLDNLPYGGHKLAFRFSGMTKEDREFLTDFIVHQTLVLGQIKKAN